MIESRSLNAVFFQGRSPPPAKKKKRSGKKKVWRSSGGLFFYIVAQFFIFTGWTEKKKRRFFNGLKNCTFVSILRVKICLNWKIQMVWDSRRYFWRWNNLRCIRTISSAVFDPDGCVVKSDVRTVELSMLFREIGRKKDRIHRERRFSSLFGEEKFGYGCLLQREHYTHTRVKKLFRYFVFRWFFKIPTDSRVKKSFWNFSNFQG